MDLNALLMRVSELEASDVHLKLGRPPIVRRDGIIEELEGWPPLTDADLDEVVATVTAPMPERRDAFLASGELDMGYEYAGRRFRFNAFRQRGAISVACRLIPRDVPTFETLHMPPGVSRLAHEQRGLILVTGATGSGKSTTLAAMVDHINRTREEHIITIEDPIEMLHSDKKCIVNQREVGIDTVSFAQALRRALRQDPDVILIGELRDAETAETALQAAESGHLVLSTMHTLDATETIGRMIEFFPAAKQPMVRSILSSVLKGVISQRLLQRVDGGRVAAVEVMVVNDRISDLIRENEPEGLEVAIKDGHYYDMQTLTQALIDLTMSGLIDRENAAAAAPNRHDFLLLLGQAEKTRAAELAEAQPPPGASKPEDAPAAPAARPAAPTAPAPESPPRQIGIPVGSASRQG
jgi:twitching motility protein PilT